MTTSILLRWCQVPHICHRCGVRLNIQKRFSYKKKWAVNLPSKTNTQLALDHFDSFYRPLYGQKWPSIRVSLLSPSKYAAVINNASDREVAVEALENLGAHDIVSLAAGKAAELAAVDRPGDKDDKKSEADAESQQASLGQPNSARLEHSDQSKTDSSTLMDSQESQHHTQQMEIKPENDDLNIDNILTPDAALRSKDLQYFMPTEQVFSEKEQLLREEVQLSTFEERQISISIFPGKLPALPASLQVLTYPDGDVSDFPKPAADKAGLLNYYLLDAASILPVIALDLQPYDSVLDLCAAPGGKSLAMLQMIIAQGGHLTSNDSSLGRCRRLETVLQSYLPESLRSEFVTVKHGDGLRYREPAFTKVLVDVPCNSDRHVVTEEDNNLFKPGRIKERLQLTTLQKNLLLAGIRSCRPGGSVVYSTCTLAAVQNDGVVQAAVEELWETSDIDVIVEDLAPMTKMFSHTFSFHSGTRLGQLVLPCLTNNFGPMYFCKLKRLR